MYLQMAYCVPKTGTIFNVRANFNKICEETSFLLFQKTLKSALLLKLKANYLEKKYVATPITLCGFQQPLQRSTFPASS